MAKPELHPETKRDVSDFLRDWLRSEGLPGASLGVIRDGELAYATGVGSRDLAANDPATADTLYGIGSVTKSFTALAIMQLAEAGELAVTDPVADHVAFDLGSDDDPITIHDLLTHSSGIPSLGVSTVLLSRRTGVEEKGVPMGGVADFLSHVRGATGEVAGPPGERFFYCNAGYSLLGLIVAERSGMDFDRYVEAEILDPLGMDRALFREDEFEAATNRLTPYAIRGGDPEPTPLPVRELSFPAGGLVTSVTALSDYVRMQMAGGELDGTRLLSADGVAAMHRGHVETPAGRYGYGWRRREVLGRTLVGHSGSIYVSTAYAGFTDDREYGIVLGCNASPGYPLSIVAEGVLATLLGEDPAAALPFFARRERYDALTGEYESYRGIQTGTVTERGGLLELQYDGPLGGDPIPLIPTEDPAGAHPGDPDPNDPDPDDPDTDEPSPIGGSENRSRTVRFEAPAPAGHRREIEFEVAADGSVDLFVDRWRLHRVE